MADFLEKNWIGILSLIIAIVSAVFAYMSSSHTKSANELTKTQMQRGERPWLLVQDEQIVIIREKSDYRIQGKLVNMTGGPALDIKFKILINETSSDWIKPNSALLPNNTLILSQGFTAQRPPINGDIITWVIEFEDMNHRKYRTTQKMKFNTNVGMREDLGYFPEEII